ncbi:MAG: hypothetical protein ABJN84_05330 [Flavobacteriaceae bacterium]
MTSHTQLSDKEFEALFEKGNLPPSLFSHIAHLRLAWLYINKYGEEKAAVKMCQEIKQFDQLHGKGDKFHKTITVAAVKLVKHFMNKSETNDFEGFIKEFPRLKTAFKELLGFHYSFDIASSEKAKAEFVAPDLLPFS